MKDKPSSILYGFRFWFAIDHDKFDELPFLVNLREFGCHPAPIFLSAIASVSDIFTKDGFHSFFNPVEDPDEVLPHFLFPVLKLTVIFVSRLNNALQTGLDLDKLLCMLDADLREAWHDQAIRFRPARIVGF